MTTDTSRSATCPVHGHALVPIHSIHTDHQRRERAIVGLTCPEPYCEHRRMLTREEQDAWQRERDLRAHRAAIG